MAGFCTNCGAALAEGVKFCTGCGRPTGAAAQSSSPAAAPPPASSAPPPVAAAPAPAKGGSPVVKILLIVLGVIALLVILSLGTCLYGAYRVKKAVESSELGAGIRKGAADMRAATTPYHGKKDPCGFVSAAEVGEALGKPVASAEAGGDSRCDYRFGPEPGDVLPIEFTWEGGKLTMNLTHGAMKGISGMETFTAVPGIGDEAYLGPMNSVFMFRKGDVMVNIDLRGNLQGDAAKRIGALIASRL